MPERNEVATLIVGAGVTGVALARELARRGHHRVAVADKEARVAFHTSGRNSGVVHAGYNPRPGTLKARLCVDGNRMLRDFAHKRGVPLLEGGILIVAACDREIPRLEELLRRGQESGVPGMRLVGGDGIADIEPHATGVAAVHAPSGASIDAAALVAALAEEARSAGVEVLLGQGVDAVERRGGGFEARLGDRRLRAGRLINCAGLHADRVAHPLGAGLGYRILPVRGEYRLVRPERRSLARSMIYPVPDLAFPFLGVHWTRTATGEVKVGPNAVPALGREAYRWRQSSIRGAWELAADLRSWKLLRQPGFARLIGGQLLTSLSRRRMAAAAATLVPGTEARDLLPGPAGIRAQLLDADGRLVEDLTIEEKDGAVHVLNVVSPGLTCALAFAAYLADRIEGR